MHRRGRVLSPLLCMLILGCTLPPLATPTATATSTPTASPSPTRAVTPSPSPTPSPTPPAIPDVTAGELITTRIAGLRVHQRPGVDELVVTRLLPLDAVLETVMGPVPVDDLGWYLVVDADAAEPEFEDGWVAAGSAPEPFLGTTGRQAEDSPFVTSMAQTGDAEEGPIEIDTEAEHRIRWIALDPERSRCAFAVSLALPSRDPIPAIRATVGSGVDRGTLQPQTFAALGASGPVFVSVASDCAWALVIVRVPPATPAPSPSPTPSA